MNVKFRGWLFVILLISTSETLLAQKNSDPKFLLKTWLFLEHENTKSVDATLFPIKDSSLFNLFQDGTDFKLDTLKMTGFSSNYIFLAITLTGPNPKVKQLAIAYKKPGLVEYMSIPVDNCDAYILCINKYKGTSYRLKGFVGNDFFNLVHEIQLAYLVNYSRKLSLKQFFKNYFVSGLDFECIGEGLKSDETDFNKYPCLKNCSDIIERLN